MPDPLLLRADASAESGAGHVMRTLALAQAWQRRGGEAHLASTELDPRLARRVEAAGVRTHAVAPGPGAADALGDLAARLDAPGVILDGYGFGRDFILPLRQGGLRILRIEDAPEAGHHGEDQVVNPNLYMQDLRGEVGEGGAERFTGPRYALLRPEFRQPPTRLEPRPGPRLRLLVTFGGSDPSNATELALNALKRVAVPLEVRIVLGPARTLAPPLLPEGNHALTLLTDVGDMAAQMAWADAALCAAGGTCLELARCGVPALTLTQALNQIPVAQAIDRLGLGWNLGKASDLHAADLAAAIERFAHDAVARVAMAAEGPRQVDGRGSDRVAAAWDLGGLRLRKACETDAERLFAWANDPLTRNQSFQSDPIRWADHTAWLARCLADPGTRMLIAEDLHGKALGQVRFQAQVEAEVISVGLAPEMRGHGLGWRIIAKACASLAPSRHVHAYIKAGNEASLRAFARAGFEAPLPDRWGGAEALRMDWKGEGT